MISEFAKEKVFWTRKMNLKLVKFIESKPNIWHPKHPKYTSIAYRDKTYADFAAKYGNEFTGQAVRDRWTNIRSTFTYYLRKSKACLIKPEGEVYNVKWHLWDACSFLLKVTKPNISIPTVSSEWQEDEIKVNEYNMDEEEEISNEEYKPSCSEMNNQESDVTCQNIANGILNVLKNVQNDVLNVDDSKHGQFGQTLMEKLSNMSSLEVSRTSCKILDILWLYHEDNPLNPNAVKSEDTF